MELIIDPKMMQKRSRELRNEGNRLVFIPTMGALHDGHLSLIREGKKHGNIIIMSIYLNPAQFSPNEDLSSYPACLDKDLEKAKSAGTDLVFCPSDKVMYPDGYQTYVETVEITKGLCGASRPGHFRGVTTVVLKLFNIVNPHVAIFGEKDFQQLKAIMKMVEDLNLEVEIVGAPIVREEDGLAMSSRNAYLAPVERRAARSINEGIKKAAEAVKKGERSPEKLISIVKKTIEKTKIGKIEYVRLCNPDSLEDVDTLNSSTLLAVAAKFGKARLIDNCILKA